MALFHYTARNPQGEAQHGTLEADSSGSVAEHLFGNHLTPIEIREVEPQTSRPSLSIPSWRRSSVRLEELVMLCRQLHTLLKAGVPILRGLDGLAETTRNPTLAATLKDLSTDIQSGRELHQALARHRKIFSPLFVSLVEVGEQTGRLRPSDNWPLIWNWKGKPGPALNPPPATLWWCWAPSSSPW